MYDRNILNELKALLIKRFPGEIAEVILFGSQVNGDAEEFSDYDILIILNHDYDWRYERKITDVCWEIDYKYNIFTDVKVISTNELQTIRGKQPYIQNALENGLLV